MSYNSKYSGQQVENLLDQVAQGGGITEETDPIFSASPAAQITDENISSWNNKVDKVDGKQLSTEDFTTLLKQKLDGLSNYDDTEIQETVTKLRTDLDTLVSGDTTAAIKTFNEVIAFLDGISDTEDLSGIISSIEQQIAGKMDEVTLAAVATSGNYNDLSNKPTIPSAVTESTVSGWGFTKNTGTYSKPSTGIPKSDLASSVQTSLGKADTALQSEQYKGTVTGVKINGSTKSPSSGVVDLGTVITSHQDLSGKQDKLVSGTNIKTINGASILGSGDIVIEGGGGSSSGEDIRYFTEFTVEDFIEACETLSNITFDTTELFNAMKSNKVICVPYRGYDKGFIVASYKSGENEEYPSMYLQKGGVEYYAWTGDSHELVGELPTYSSVQVVEMAGGEVAFEFLDNHIYRITDPVDYLLPVFYNIQKGVTIHFISGEAGTTIEIMYMLSWANGEIPQIEPNTCYELSLMQNTADGCNAVLTKFKLVEE